MSKVFLMFCVALLALMSGALFYAARLPVESADPAPAATPVATDDSYPAFTMPDLDGVERSLSDWDGKHRILNFWATWCGPCKQEIPDLIAFQAAHGERDFQIIGIAVDFMEEVQFYAESVDFNYPIVVGETDAMALAESSGIAFGAMPFTMFVARDGEYLGAFLGRLHDSHLADIVNIFERLDAGEISRDEARGAFRLL